MGGGSSVCSHTGNDLLGTDAVWGVCAMMNIPSMSLGLRYPKAGSRRSPCSQGLQELQGCASVVYLQYRFSEQVVSSCTGRRAGTETSVSIAPSEAASGAQSSAQTAGAAEPALLLWARFCLMSFAESKARGFVGVSVNTL